MGSELNRDSTSIDKDIATKVVDELSREYSIDSVMTFGGEPLLFAETVFAIHKTAEDCKIPSRQIITNGFFSKDIDRVKSVARRLCESGITSLLLSVDAFHKEHIPINIVFEFAKEVCKYNRDIIKLHPAWVVNRDFNNGYNKITEECLEYFDTLNIPVSNGNNIFLAGNATKNLSQFYERKPIDLKFMCGDAPYTGRLDEVSSISIDPIGNVVLCAFVIGNVYESSIIDIVENYNPYDNEFVTALLKGGISSLIELAEEKGANIDIAKYQTACEICRSIINEYNV